MFTIQGILSIVDSLLPTLPDKVVVIDCEDFASSLSRVTHGLNVLVPSLKFPSLPRLSLALARTLRLVAKHSESSQSKIQLRKVFSRFRCFVEDNEDCSVNKDDPEVCVHYQLRVNHS